MNLQQPLQIIPRPSLHAELVERIRGLIVDGTLPAGSKIPEKDLCAKFGVSRTPMREALKVLAVDGLVSLEPNRGAWVSKLTIQELEEVFPVMGALEALSGELACKHITSEEFAVIEDLHNQMVLHFQKKDLDRYFHANQQIHEAILAAAKNATLSAQYRSLATRVRQARYLANMSADRWQQAVEEHEEMLIALKNRDGEQLAETLKRHLENKCETVRNWLSQES